MNTTRLSRRRFIRETLVSGLATAAGGLLLPACGPTEPTTCAPAAGEHPGVGWGPSVFAPVFHGFAGGKGVATAAGIVFALSWPLGLALAAIWLVMAVGFKISSLAALTTAALMPIGAFVIFGNAPTAWAIVPISLLLFWRHRSNIRQLLEGKERTIGR